MNEHTLTQLRTLRLDGMVRALEEQATSTAASALSFEDRFSLLVQRQVAWRDDRRVERLLKAAKLKQTAVIKKWRERFDHKRVHYIIIERIAIFSSIISFI